MSEYIDDQTRIRWRAQIAMDMFACLGHVLEMIHGDERFVWLENDVWLQSQELINAMKIQRGTFACWKPEWQRSKMYLGYGTQCFVIDARSIRAIRQHLLSYSLVQPADWIISDAFPTMQAVSVSVHKSKRSTRLMWTV